MYSEQQIGTTRVNCGNIRISISAFYFAAGLIFASWASRIPDIKQQLALNDSALGYALFAIPMGQLVMMACSGYLVTHFGSRSILRFAIIAYAAVLMSISFAYNFQSLFLTLFFFGVTANMMNISLNTQACELENIYGRTIMSSFHGLWSMGGLLGGIVGIIFVRYGYPIEIHYASVVIMSSLLVIVAGKYLISNKIQSDKPSSQERQFSLSKIDRTILLIGIIGFCGMFCEGTLFDWSSVYFSSVLQADKDMIRIGYIAGLGTMTFGRFIADRFISRYHASKVLKVCGSLIVSGLLLSTVFPYLISATIGFMLVGLGISCVIPICYSMAGHQKKISASIAITIVSSVSFIGFMIGPPLIGLFSEMTNLRIALGAASAFGIFIAVLAGKTNAKHD